MLSPAIVVAYDPSWPATFESLKAAIAPSLDGISASVEHVGSTAVPGLAAKPIIDMDVVVEDQADVPEAIEALVRLGYIHDGDLGIVGREAFTPPPGSPAYHLYVVVRGSQPHRDHVDLRDYLRGHPEECERYAAKKREVAHLLLGDREDYVRAKAGIIEEMLRAAGGEAYDG